MYRTSVSESRIAGEQLITHVVGEDDVEVGEVLSVKDVAMQ